VLFVFTCRVVVEDVIGVVKSVDDLSTIMIRSQNREAKVRKFMLVDQSGAEIRVTLWGNEVTVCWRLKNQL